VKREPFVMTKADSHACIVGGLRNQWISHVKWLNEQAVLSEICARYEAMAECCGHKTMMVLSGGHCPRHQCGHRLDL